MSDKIAIPTDTAKLALARKVSNRTSAVYIGDDGRLLPSGDEDVRYKVIVKEISGDRKPSGRASKLKACKGLKGCDFAKCSEDALGKLPKNLEGLCSNEPKDDLHV